ncbi:MAG TPA: GNAT family N-acetyltransferase [Pyrinomonadaceae bacterium]
MQLIQATTTEEMDLVRTLFEEYAAGLGFSLCFQSFDQELAELPGRYAPPWGRLLLAYQDDAPAGCVGLRKLDEETCEMKRLFIRSEFRKHGLGKVLVQRLIDEARRIGYKRMRLDTVPGVMDPAIRLYEDLGFDEIPPYYDNPFDDVKYMELSLMK